MDRRLRVAFIHPHLGIGGAERLVLDAATHLRAAGHRVTIFTANYDPEHCFEETKNGGLELRVYGARLPMQVAQHLRAPCAITRMIYLACRIAMSPERFDVIFLRPGISRYSRAAAVDQRANHLLLPLPRSAPDVA